MARDKKQKPMALNASSSLEPSNPEPKKKENFLNVTIKHGSAINTQKRPPSFQPLEKSAPSRLEQTRHTKPTAQSMAAVDPEELQETLHDKAIQVAKKPTTAQPLYIVSSPELPEHPQTVEIFASQELRRPRTEQKEFFWEGHTVSLTRRVTPKQEVFLDLSIDGKLSHSTQLLEFKTLRQVWSRSKIILQGVPEDRGYRLDDLPVGMRPVFIKDDNLVGKSLFIGINGFSVNFLPDDAQDVQPVLSEPTHLEYDKTYTMNVDKTPAMMDLGDERTRFAVEVKNGDYRIRFLDPRLPGMNIPAQHLPVTVHVGRREKVDDMPELRYLPLPEHVEGLTEDQDIASRSHLAITFNKGSIELSPLSVQGVRLLKNDRMVFAQQTERTALQKKVKEQNDREDRR